MTTIKNLITGETIPISRDVRVTHPEWVHRQCGTSSESELQSFLDQVNVQDFYDRDGAHIGPDSAGIQMHREEAP